MTDCNGLSRDLAKSDTANDEFNRLMVTTTAGSVVYNTNGGNTYTVTVAPVGVWIPVGNATNVRVASTAVGLIVS